MSGSYLKQIKLGPLFHTQNSEWIKYLKVKNENTKILGENLSGYNC